MALLRFLHFCDLHLRAPRTSSAFSVIIPRALELGLEAFGVRPELLPVKVHRFIKVQENDAHQVSVFLMPPHSTIPCRRVVSYGDGLASHRLGRPRPPAHDRP